MGRNVKSVQWATGPVGGSWFEINQGIASLVARRSSTLRIDLVIGGGGINPTLVDEGKVEFGTTIDLMAEAAYNGQQPFSTSHRKLMTIGRGWSPLPFHFVSASGREVPLREAIKTRGARIAIPPVGTFDELTFRRILEFFNLSYDLLSELGVDILQGDYKRIPAAFKSGEVDYMFGATSAPGSTILALFDRPGGASLLSLDMEVIRHLVTNFGMRADYIDRSHYPALSDAVATVAMDTIFLVNAEVDATIVTEVLRCLLESRGELSAIHPSMKHFDPLQAVSGGALPLHRGAATAYRSSNPIA